MRTAYPVLRRVEHRLQMVADRQTHSLPAGRPELERFALFMGYRDATTFATALLHTLESVRRQDAELFGSDNPAADDAVFTPQRLVDMGFGEPDRVLAALKSWRAGGPRALRSPRGRALLEDILPALLQALANQRQPDTAFSRLDTLLARLPAGVHVLSLFHRRPMLIDRVAAVLGAAPSLADHLAQIPAALEGLLAPSAIDIDRPPRSTANSPTPARWRTPSPSSAAPFAARNSASPSRRWRAASMPTPPASPAPLWPTQRSSPCSPACSPNTNPATAPSRAAAWWWSCWAKPAGAR